MVAFKDFQFDVQEILEKIDKFITNYIDLARLTIPVVIFKGDESDLPNIFESINSGGTKLSKYEIFAASWQGIDFQIEDDILLKWVDEKYEKMQEKSGLEIDDYMPGSIIESKRINLFEYAYAIGKIIRNDYPDMFGGRKSEDASEIDSIGFGLLAAVLEVDLKQMGGLSDCFYKDMDSSTLINLKNKLVSCSKEVNEVLIKFIRSADGKNFTKYMFAQIVSIIASLFKIRYRNVGNLKMVENDGSSQKVRLFKQNMPKHYLYDMIREYWSNTGDTKVGELLKQDINKNKYLHGIPDEWWNSALHEWLAEQEKKNSKSIDIVKKLFLNYMFNLTNSTTTSKKFDIEHIVPQKRIERRFRNGAISAVGNLCILPEFENRSKKDQTLYEYFDERVSTASLDEQEIQDKYFYPTRSEIDFVKNENFTQDSYLKFLKNRHDFLAQKFIKLISQI